MSVVTALVSWVVGYGLAVAMRYARASAAYVPIRTSRRRFVKR